MDSPTNQIFVILEDKKLQELQQKDVRCSLWERQDENHMVVRFATSWGTGMEEIEELIGLL